MQLHKKNKFINLKKYKTFLQIQKFVLKDHQTEIQVEAVPHMLETLNQQFLKILDVELLLRMFIIIYILIFNFIFYAGNL